MTDRLRRSEREGDIQSERRKIKTLRQKRKEYEKRQGNGNGNTFKKIE